MDLESEGGPIRLRKVVRKDSTKDKKSVRSQSVPRRNTIGERTLEIEQAKAKRVRQILLEQEEQREKEEQEILKARRQRPVLYQRRKQEEPKIWDENGCLIDQDIALRHNRGKSRDESRTSHMDPKSIAILRLREARGFESEAMPEKKQIGQPLKRSVSREAFKSFVERQELANRKKVASMEPKKRRHSSVMSKKSIELTSPGRESKQKQKIPVDEEEFSFMPDMSLTKNVKANGLPCSSVARTKLRNIEMNGRRMEREMAEMKNCTFFPDMESTQARREEARVKATEILMKKQERAKQVEQSVRKAEDEAVEQRRYMTAIPARTRKVHDMLDLFKDPSETKQRESLAPRKRRSASVPRFSKQ